MYWANLSSPLWSFGSVGLLQKILNPLLCQLSILSITASEILLSFLSILKTSSRKACSNALGSGCGPIINGFNLYFGLKESKWKKYYWLDLQKLCLNLSKHDQVLVKTKYFTSRVAGPHNKTMRQKTFLEALSTLNDSQIFFGRYQVNTWQCSACETNIEVPKEKMTDVNIGVELLTDAFQNKFETALIITADSDLKGPIVKTRELFPDKIIVVAFPPKRYSIELDNAANSAFHIGRKKIADSLLPEQIIKADSFVIKRPAEWR